MLEQGTKKRQFIELRHSETFIESMINEFNDVSNYKSTARDAQTGDKTSTFNRISGVMVSVFASSVVDHGFEPRSGKTKDYTFGICCYFSKHTPLRSKSRLVGSSESE